MRTLNAPDFKNANWIGFLVLFEKECKRFLKVVGQTVFSPLISASLYLLVFGVNLSDRIAPQNGVDYLQFIIPGLMAMGMMNNAFQNSTSSIISSKFHGDFQDLKVSPLVPNQIIWAYSLAATTRGFIVGAAVLGVGELFYFSQRGAFMAIDNIGLLFLFIVLCGLIFGFLGMAVAIASNSFEQVNVIGTFVLLPLIYLGGVFFSTVNMHPIWRTVSHVNPLFYLINGIRHAVLGRSDISLGLALTVTLIFVLITYILANIGVRKGSYVRF